MEFFNKTKAVKLRSHHNKYLVADDDKKSVRQSRNGSTRKARWLVERVDHNPEAIRLKSLHGVYLTASTTAFLLGFTGNKVTQTQPDHPRDLSIEWVPVRDGFQVKLVTAFGGTCLRANGGTRPWKDSVTHDVPSVTKSWVLWDVEAVEIPENEELTDYLSLVSSVSSLSDDLFVSEIGSEVGSPVSIHSNSSPMVPFKKSGMELFHKAKAVRLRSNHEKYLTAEEDEESVTQARNGASRNARWAVEFLETDDNIIRLKSCYGKYLMASNMPFLLGMTGRKVIQTAGRKDSSVEWEPIREGLTAALKMNSPPESGEAQDTARELFAGKRWHSAWRNSVTHDVPNRTATQDWILWDVDVVEILLLQLPQPNQSNDSMGSSVSRAADGRVIYYSIADERGNVEEGLEGLSFTFKGNGLYELTKRLEEETGLEEIIVCSRSPLNGKLYPLRLQLPPKNVDMHVVVLQSSSRGE
ncbi:hypothetical protein C3L33_09083, partial [Rhododendron williamsianum]